MPTSATTMDNEVKLTYNLPETSPCQDEDSQPPLPPLETFQPEASTPPSQIEPSLPMLNLYKYNLVQTLLSKSLDSFPVNDPSANITIEEIQPVENILRRLTPVSLEDIPVHMLSVAQQPPYLIPLRPRSSSTPTMVPSSPGQVIHDDEILESVCGAAGFDLPLYSHPLSDWSKLEAREQESANEEAASEASYLDQSWDETQTLPLFEPTLDFDTLMNY